nr:unnamed protein product [Callosobruchus analis]
MGGKKGKTTSSYTPPLPPKRRRRHSRRRSSSTASSSSSESSDGEARKRIIRLEKRISKLQAQVGTSSISSISTAITETVIPLFDPGVNIITAEEWIRRVDELKLCHKWDDLTTAKLATSRLRGNARRWYDGSQITLNSWELLKSLLILNFQSGSNVSLSSLPPLSIDKDIPDMTSVSKTGLQRDMIKFEDTLTESERNSTFALLQEHRDCISLSLKDLGRTSTEEMHIRCSTDEPIIDLTEGEWLLAVQLQDEQVRLIREILQEKRVTGSTKQYFDNYSLQGGIVFKKLHSGMKLWLFPRGVRWQICRLCHDEMGHFASTGVSPLEALAGYKPRHVAESYILNEVQGNLGRVDIRALRRTISERISEDQKRQKERFDKTRAEATKYEEGQFVRINYTPPATGGSKKLLPTFKGPFRVIKVLPNDRYELEDLREGRKKRRSVAAVDSMKPWIVLRGLYTTNIHVKRLVHD